MNRWNPPLKRSLVIATVFRVNGDYVSAEMSSISFGRNACLMKSLRSLEVDLRGAENYASTTLLRGTGAEAVGSYQPPGVRVRSSVPSILS